ncbi:MAG: hypothetical protein EXX96DRAFT_132033 [Benjaminiella poitrasii]|nr:MAG: hypothetical protein EXX96DRAFT_132033 [Benjaminiella poitrasii]
MRPNNTIAVERKKVETMLKKNKEAENREENSINKYNKEEKKNKKKKSKSVESSDKKNSKVQTTYIPTPKTYSSASDSDETDNENRSSTVTQRKPQTTVMSASDSDETDIEKRSSVSKQKNAHRQEVLSASDSDETDKESSKTRKDTPSRSTQPLSDSDSDETDRESTKPVIIKRTKSTRSISSKQSSSSSSDESASDSDETDNESTQKQEYKRKNRINPGIKPKTSEYISDSSNISSTSSDESDSESDSNAVGKNAADLRGYVKKREHLTSNRISFRSKREIDPNKSAAVNYATRLSDAFVTNVNSDYFVSDSESETDSGEDYDRRDYPAWQRTLSWNKNPEKVEWPKPRKFGYSDKLKLEKRIKKICRRENISFSEAQELFSGSHRKEHLRFFQKIGKAFPDRSLASIAKQCKEMYHTKRNNTPWTPEEIKKLDGLIKIHGNNAELLSQYMNRSPKNINDFIFGHAQKSKKFAKRWTREEDEMLAKAIAKEKKEHGERMSFLSIVPIFKGERSQKQIYSRYYSIRHLIQPDGTLIKERKATLYEELRYLKTLLRQAEDLNLTEESQLDFSKDRGFVNKHFYLKNRAKINGFEKMKIKDILKILIEKQTKVIQSRKEEGLLESENESQSM